MLNFDKTKIAVIGLGYVGLPLAVEFGKKYFTIGFDINQARLAELKNGSDNTLEISPDELAQSEYLQFSDSVDLLKSCNFFVVTVPTPIDEHKQPDLSPLIKASEMIGKLLKKGDIVIYESTVFPGATEEFCVPILEKFSNLKYNKDIFVGYSPERINPGDKQHRLTNILKITSGSTIETADIIDTLYGSIIEAGTYKANSIKVAEAAKVIENTQRDVNIGLINELSIIFNMLDIDSEQVLLAAGTKWNFLPFRPGLVGGHCIGVDPYYLTHKAQSVGYHPELILAGRRLNDSMGSYIGSQLVKAMLKKRISINGSSVLVMGLTFKENCPDIRNTKVVDVINELKDYGISIDCYDPWVDKAQVENMFGFVPVSYPSPEKYDAIVLAVSHDEFKIMGVEKLKTFTKNDHVIYDLKYLLPLTDSDLRL